jgi:hypothetical protein
MKVRQMPGAYPSVQCSSKWYAKVVLNDHLLELGGVCDPYCINIFYNWWDILHSLTLGLQSILWNIMET